MSRAMEIQRWLEETPVLDAIPGSKEREAFEQLVGHEGFRVFLGLMLGSRAAQYQMLANLPIDSSAAAARASVIQGTIKGIDLARETVLEQFISAGADTQGAKA